MARHCMRPGCDRPAAARLTYDTEAAAVWLDRPVPDSEPAQQVCSVHAATLTAPLGWTVTDRRLMAVGPVGDSAHPSLSERGSATGARLLGSPAEPARSEAPPSEGAPEEPAPVGSRPSDRSRSGPAEAPETAEVDQPAAVLDQPAAVLDQPAAVLDKPAAVDQPAGAEDTPPAKPKSPKAAPGRKDRPKLLDRAFEWTGPQHSVLTTERSRRVDRLEAPDSDQRD
ncbi:MAG: DUF3499 family protein [Microthrixaceae bacterium]|nr:DUF3499 family protein [Microthrixaceae bacterium]